MGDMSPPVIVESRITRYSRGTRTTHYLFALDQMQAKLAFCEPTIHVIPSPACQVRGPDYGPRIESPSKPLGQPVTGCPIQVVGGRAGS